MRYFSVIFLLSFFGINLVGQNAEMSKIQWLSFQDALKKQKEHPKKIIVDVYTDWCGWCKHMDKTTFANPSIAQYINANYYAVKFNAEGKDTIVYRGKTYTNSNIGKIDQYGRTITKSTHDLAVELLNQRLSYPSIVYLDDSAKVIAPISGYRNETDIQPFLIYFAENLHTYINLQDFINDFNTTFIDSLKPKSLDLKWEKMQFAIDNSVKLNKKVLVFFDTDWCPTCKIMNTNTFNDSEVIKIITDNFIPVEFNATSKDSIVYGNQTFINENKEHPFHQFAVSVMQGQMKFPAICFFTPEHTMIQVVPGYFAKESLKPILLYFGKDYYKTVQWTEYLKTYKPN